MDFDFKKYHLRSINAETAEERATINQELKDLYATLSPEEQRAFNEGLQSFLAKEMGRLGSDYQAIKASQQNSDNL
jgi:uncharacterized membrane protein